tara:strand:- start:7411 stop:7821 length:411 start_codon:yes stop_codon:yes gene_type:complete
MKKTILTICLIVATIVGAQAQTKGDWYVGTGDISNVAWTEVALAPTVGYGVMDNLMIGLSVSQQDSTVDMSYDLHARYFYKGYFAYASTEGLDTETLSLGVGRMFTIHKSVFVDPKIVYNTGDKTTNLTLGFGLKF